MDTSRDSLKGVQAARKRFRRLAVIAAGVLTLGAVLWGGLWWFGAHALETAVIEAVAARRAAGEEIAVQKVAVGGFPGALTVTVSALTATARLPAGPLAVTVPRLIVTAPPLAPGRFRLAAPAPFTAVGGGAFAVTGRLNDGAVTLDGNQSAGRVAVAGVRLTQPGRAPVTLRGLTATWAPGDDGEDQGEDQGEGAGDRRVTFVATGLEGVGAAAERAAEIRVSGRLSGPLAGANAVDWAEWRDAGGVLETDEIAVSWADLRLNGSGSWTLDKALRPAGAGTFEVAGLPALIERWAATGQLTPQQAALARLAVATLGGGGKGQVKVKVPFSLQAGRVWIGPFAVADLPTLAW